MEDAYDIQIEHSSLKMSILFDRQVFSFFEHSSSLVLSDMSCGLWAHRRDLPTASGAIAMAAILLDTLSTSMSTTVRNLRPCLLRLSTLGPKRTSRIISKPHPNPKSQKAPKHRTKTDHFVLTILSQLRLFLVPGPKFLFSLTFRTNP